jgi:hypothetical protein
MTITVDGDTYAATVTATDQTTLALEDLSREFLKALYHGDQAVVRVGDERWEMRSLPEDLQ